MCGGTVPIGIRASQPVSDSSMIFLGFLDTSAEKMGGRLSMKKKNGLSGRAFMLYDNTESWDL